MLEQILGTECSFIGRIAQCIRAWNLDNDYPQELDSLTHLTSHRPAWPRPVISHEESGSDPSALLPRGPTLNGKVCDLGSGSRLV